MLQFFWAQKESNYWLQQLVYILGVQNVSLNIGFLLALPYLPPFLNWNNNKGKRSSKFGELSQLLLLSPFLDQQQDKPKFCKRHKFDYDWKIKKKSTISCFDIFHWVYFKSSCSVFSPTAPRGQSSFTWASLMAFAVGFLTWAHCSRLDPMCHGQVGAPGLSVSTLGTQTALQLWGLAWKCGTVKVESKWRKWCINFCRTSQQWVWEILLWTDTINW